jgi:dienelactone hydrolase
MATYASGRAAIDIDQFEPYTGAPHPALLVLHGSGGAASYWMDQFAPALNRFGAAIYAPHYFARKYSSFLMKHKQFWSLVPYFGIGTHIHELSFWTFAVPQAGARTVSMEIGREQ